MSRSSSTFWRDKFFRVIPTTRQISSHKIRISPIFDINHKLCFYNLDASIVRTCSPMWRTSSLWRAWNFCNPRFWKKWKSPNNFPIFQSFIKNEVTLKIHRDFLVVFSSRIVYNVIWTLVLLFLIGQRQYHHLHHHKKSFSNNSVFLFRFQDNLKILKSFRS